MSKLIINELSELERAGVIDEATAGRIRDYYAAQTKAASANRLNIVFAILGTILVGMGIILVIAHNWDQLSRVIKVFIAFLPVLIGQGLCTWALVKHKFDRVWLECSSVFLFFGVGACIAMVSQVYHIPSSGGTFVLTWMLLVFPLIYIMRSSITSLLYLVGITAYGSFYSDLFAGADYTYWCLLALAIPYYVMLIKTQPRSNLIYIHHWFVPLSVTICLGFVMGNAETLFLPAYICLMAVFYLVGTYAGFMQNKILSNGYLVIGSVGTVIILLICSFENFWNFWSYENDPQVLLLTTPGGWITLLLFMIAMALAWKWMVLEKQEVNWLGLLFIPFILGFFLLGEAGRAAAILVNLLTLGAGLATIQRGNRLNHLGILNYGLAIIALLVICRFFDEHISFVVRGLMFIAVGVGFFVANSRLIKKRKLHES